MTMKLSGWVLFVGGLIFILVLQLIAIDIVYTDWGWNRSFFAQHFFWPLLGLAFLSCIAGPLFGVSPLRRKLLFSLLAGLAASALYFGSSFVIFLLYGA